MTIDFNTLAAQATQADVFDGVTVAGEGITCVARGAAAPACYSVSRVGEGVVVRLCTSDRWLSESIETDLMHTGDSIEELVADELVELGGDARVPRIRHFRNDAREYVFEHDVEADGSTALRVLLAYEAAFRQLGDMAAAEGDS